MEYIKYDNVKNFKINEYPLKRVEVEQFFNIIHFVVEVNNIKIDVMLNKSTQIFENNVFQKDILNYLAYNDELKFNYYFDIDFKVEDKMLNTQELDKEIKKQIAEGLKEKNITDRIEKRKEQVKYFVQKKIIEKKYNK